LIDNRWSELVAPSFSSRLVNSAGVPLIEIDAISAFGLIRSDKVDAGAEEIFLTVTTALTERLRSVSIVGKVAAMSYFWTCHVAVARVSSCPLAVETTAIK